LITENIIWTTYAIGAYCWHCNNPANKNTYGALYNWYAVNVGALCPVGWHVPTKEEWTTMINYLGGENIAGGKLKEVGNTHWQYYNEGATNETGFTALPGGGRSPNDGTFGSTGYGGSWWISTPEHHETSAWRVDITCLTNGAYIRALSKHSGFSVRCIKDN